MSTQQRKFQGIWIPADVWLDRSLSTTEKVMLVEIGSLQDEERGCYASNSYFADFFGLSPSRVSEIINGLAEKGLVKIELIKEGKQIVERRIRPAVVFGNPKGYSENTENPIRKTEEGYSEKAIENNTKSNNTKRDNKASPKFDPLTACPPNVSSSVWADWCQHRKEIRKPLTAKACEQQANKLANHPDPDEVLRKSITNGWTGIFPDSVGGRLARNGQQGRHHGLDQIDYSSGQGGNVLDGGF